MGVDYNIIIRSLNISFHHRCVKKARHFFIGSTFPQRYEGILNYAHRPNWGAKKQVHSFGNELNELYNNQNKKVSFAYCQHWPEEKPQEINVFFQKTPCILQFANHGQQKDTSKLEKGKYKVFQSQCNVRLLNKMEFASCKLTNVHKFKTFQLCSFHKNYLNLLKSKIYNYEGIGLFMRETKLEASQRTLRQETLMYKGRVKKRHYIVNATLGPEIG